VVLDAVQDPGNAGTIIRTADAAGAKAVIALPGTVDIWSPKVIRGTMGSILHLPVFGWPEGRMNLMGELSRISCPCVLADPHSQTPFWDLRLPGGPRALILGNEGNGPGPEWRGANVIDVAIPIYGKAESLNVAVSAGILIYALIR
jgi:TrmH family RNA methyltransferase